MTKIIFILSLCTTILLSANIDKKIASNKKILTSQNTKKKKTSFKIKQLAQKIKKQNANIIKLEKDIKSINKDIEKHQELLENSKQKLAILQNKSSKLIKDKKNNEEDIVDTIIEEFSSSIALKLASKNSLSELIDNEIYTLLSQNSKDEILKLNNNYTIVSNNTKENQKNIKKISKYIKKREKRKKELNRLKKRHSTSLVDLEKQHKSYQKELNKVIQEQKSLKELLSQLNILKKEELRKARLKREKKRRAEERRKRAAKRKSKKSKKTTKNDYKKDEDVILSSEDRNQQYAKNLNLNVRKIGSSTDGVEIVRYRGRRTIPPIKSFKVLKKFGTYYDPIYKIKLFNESVVLKPKTKKSKVVSIFNGKIVYAKKNAGVLGNVVIVQHQNGLHTIYSHLDEIAPTLQVGKWIKKGYVVGRVDDTLMFQATKNSAHVNPRDLFRI